MKKFKKIIALVLTVCSLLTVCAVSASAATKGYDAFKTRTITIQTNDKALVSHSITFKSAGDNVGGKPPILSLEVYNYSTKKTSYYRVTGPRYGTLGDTISSTLKLDRNTKYKVTVSYLYDKSLNWGTYPRVGGGKESKWYPGTWYITGTKNLKSYSVK